MSRFKEIELKGLKRYKAADRVSKVKLEQFAACGEVKLSGFWNCVPDILKAKEMKELLGECVAAFKKGKPLLLGIGGHVIKCGLAPLIIKLIEMGVIKGIAANGSAIVHDYELAMFGQTSEEVGDALEDGSFGMAEDTADGINALIVKAKKRKLGLGVTLGMELAESAPHRNLSLLANAVLHRIPFTVHVAVGTDIIHQHPSADGAAIGEASMRDFRIFCQSLIDLHDGGVFLNFGSAVIIPEVFLKAVSVVRNLENPLSSFTTAVFDMNMQYRSLVNVAQRPVLTSGKGYYFVGHHEIMLPLFLLSLIEMIEDEA